MNNTHEDDNKIHVTTPVPENFVKTIEVGNKIFISGIIVTARDAVHQKLIDLEKTQIPEGLKNALNHGVIYHCGPIVKKSNDGGSWRVLAAGPTTSARMNNVETAIIQKFNIKIIIGKGGMQSVDWQKIGAVYTAFIGGGALLAKKSIVKVVDVFWLETLGIPEAAWIFQIKDFGPLIVAQDANGRDLYQDVLKK
ncbi:MAG: FumA C-terminus/TtdB family hydratase beta subunit [Promethearchaeota archaeon]